ncbi:hypothetical protein E2C01_017333 [Portunus trituberculatus]|uniref:Uncharacterized protein n=1 Tax=Portunus trituberculatus TaxID=210409 RepID=A0A5B7DT38_PORTR|nr:hypothetical protein [Portunus trituberculatus]
MHERRKMEEQRHRQSAESAVTAPLRWSVQCFAGQLSFTLDRHGNRTTSPSTGSKYGCVGASTEQQSCNYFNTTMNNINNSSKTTAAITTTTTTTTNTTTSNKDNNSSIRNTNIDTNTITITSTNISSSSSSFY